MQVGGREVVTSEDRFRAACPCAEAILSYAAELMDPERTTWRFGKAIVRPSHTSAMFVCLGLTDEPTEFWISAKSDGFDGWTLRHTQVPDGEWRVR